MWEIGSESVWALVWEGLCGKWESLLEAVLVLASECDK